MMSKLVDIWMPVGFTVIMPFLGLRNTPLRVHSTFNGRQIDTVAAVHGGRMAVRGFDAVGPDSREEMMLVHTCGRTPDQEEGASDPLCVGCWKEIFNSGYNDGYKAGAQALSETVIAVVKKAGDDGSQKDWLIAAVFAVLIETCKEKVIQALNSGKE